jgi:hypothetical protein
MLLFSEFSRRHVENAHEKIAKITLPDGETPTEQLRYKKDTK